ncbi:MAG: RIP metalloprotease RseP [Emcibacteraceae bacterium]|uniref:RIP metalloprotease RseP n=1 Tax=Pseudemcibacter sp. TaxID=2943293 RepID=UPI003F698473|nr:RIP metalloprotease RseP [Emcibacteraceae bacterium]MDG1727798.1 RIP metalloprotease RseP [Emcibacteraceae bacterium]
MEALLSYGQMIASFLFVLTVLVFVHEWGHYIIARINGVRVEVFSVGFGPEIWGFNDKNGTRWKISWIPLGGYVKFFGDASEASTPDAAINEMSDEEKEVSFHHKNLAQKAAIVFAGPAVNFLFAILIIAGLYFTYGRMELSPVVGDVLEGGAAKEAGIEAGDRIVSIDGEEIETFMDIREHLLFKVEDAVTVAVLRDGQTINLNFNLGMVEDEDILGQPTKVRQIGIRSSINPEDRVLVQYGLFSALWNATIATKDLTMRNLQGLGQIIVGKRSAQELSGPITIARVAGKTAEHGLTSLINFMALISIGLGMVNLFPIPMLDGGHLLYYAIEAVRRKKMSAQAQEFGFKIGALVVLSLMIFATFNDILKID